VDCTVQAPSSDCREYSECPNPQAVNVVTLGMAIVHRKRLGKPIAELRQLMNQEQNGRLAGMALNAVQREILWLSQSLKCKV